MVNCNFYYYVKFIKCHTFFQDKVGVAPLKNQSSQFGPLFHLSLACSIIKCFSCYSIINALNTVINHLRQKYVHYVLSMTKDNLFDLFILSCLQLDRLSTLQEPNQSSNQLILIYSDRVCPEVIREVLCRAWTHLPHLSRLNESYQKRHVMKKCMLILTLLTKILILFILKNISHKHGI